VLGFRILSYSATETAQNIVLVSSTGLQEIEPFAAGRTSCGKQWLNSNRSPQVASGCAHQLHQPDRFDRVGRLSRYFTGFMPVPAAVVALAYLRSISYPIIRPILKLYKTDS
jgi:hypothetical protein